MPLIQASSNTRGSIREEDPELKSVKNRAKLWLRIWIACGRPKSEHLFNLKQRSKLHFVRYLRSVRYNGSEFTKDAAQ